MTVSSSWLIYLSPFCLPAPKAAKNTKYKIPISISLEVDKLYQHETGIRITDVDREKHTVCLIVNGSYVEAVFTPNANPDVFDNVKQILIKSMLANAG